MAGVGGGIKPQCAGILAIGQNTACRTMAVFQSDMVSHQVKGYGVVIMTNGDNGGALAQVIRRRVAQAYGWDTLDKPVLR